jgi:chemotaxis protein CheC
MNKQIENATGIACEKNVISCCTRSSNDGIDLGILLELGSIGAGHAATSLSDILQQQVLIEIPQIHRLSPYLLHQYYRRHDAPTTAVCMKLADSECDILLMFEAAEAKKIALMMTTTMVPSLEELDQAMEASAIKELANILIGSFLMAISDFTGIRLLPSTPQLAVGTFASILDNFLVKQSMVSNEALIFYTYLKRAGADANSILMIFPNPQLQELLIEKSKELMGV